MTNLHCFTSATFSYLDRVRVLGRPLQKFNPDWTFWLCLSDREPAGFSLLGERMLERYDRSLAAFELVKWYRKQLADNAPADLPAGWWAYNCYEDGTTIAH